MFIKNIIGIIGLLFISFIIISAANSFGQTTSMSGKDIYRLNCSGCHGPNREGNPPAYPALQGIDKKMSRMDVTRQIKNGKNIMPAFAHLSQDQINAVLAYLFDGKEQKLGIVSKVQQGEMLVRSNCISCHRLSGDDPYPPQARMMEPAYLGGTAQRFSFDEIVNILDRGRCYMPSFSHFTKEEKKDIYTFLETLKDDRNSPISKKDCRMMPRGRNRKCGCSW
jgi:mono/diheme cytochrome c family protein